MPDIAPQLAALLAVVALVLVLLLALGMAVLGARLRVVSRVRRRAPGSAPLELLDLLDRQGQELARLRDETARLRTESLYLRDRLAGSVSRISVVRYDAFDDMGGATSFSAALLDEHRHGMVLSAINGRSETRCYAKPVIGGASDHLLTDEEGEAIAAAIERRPAVVPPPMRRRRWAS